MTEPYWVSDEGDVTLHLGDCLDVMAAMPAGSAASIVTDAPYGLEFMGQAWDSFGSDTGNGYQEKPRWGGDRTDDHAADPRARVTAPNYYTAGHPYQVWCQRWATEALRVLKPGGHMLVFGGTRTYHRLASGIEDAGFEIRDSIHWIYGSGFPKSLDVSKAIDKAVGACGNHLYGDYSKVDGGERSNYDGQGGRWPPNVVLAHSPNCRQLGTKTVRSDGHHPASRGPGGLSTTGHGGQQGLTERAAGVEVVEQWTCADGCPVAELDRQTGVLANCGAPKTTTHDGGMFGIGQPGRIYGDVGGASRFFPVFKYTAKAGAEERPRLADGTSHPTVKPRELMEWLVRLVTPPGGTVLDPFAGSGTTAEACVIHGFRCALIEKDERYAELIKTRLRKPIQIDLFGGAA